MAKPERVAVSDPNQERDRSTRYTGKQVSLGPIAGPTPVTAKPLDVDTSATDFVNSLSGILGLASEGFRSYADNKIAEDRVKQTEQAVKGLMPTDDATRAGYEAHALVKSKGDQAKYIAKMKAFADTNPTDEEWEEAMSTGLASTQENLRDSYNLDVENEEQLYTDLNKLALNNIVSATPQLTLHRETVKLEHENTTRMESLEDSIIGMTGVGLSPEVMVLDIDSITPELQLSPIDSDKAIINAVINSQSPELIEMSKILYQGRKTSLYQRSGAIQSLDAKQRKAGAINRTIDKSKAQVTAKDALMKGEMTEEEFYQFVGNQSAKLGEDLFTESAMTSMVMDARKANYRQNQKTFQVISGLNGDAVDLPKWLTPDEYMSSVHDSLAEANEDPEVIALRLGEISTRTGMIYKPYLSSLESLTTLNVDTNSMTEDQVQHFTDVAQTSATLLSSMDGNTKEMYLSKMDASSRQVLKNFMVNTGRGDNPVQALASARIQQRMPRVNNSPEKKMGSVDEVFGKLNGWFDSGIDANYQNVLKADVFDQLGGYADPTSSVAIGNVSDHLKTGYSRFGGGKLVKGNNEYYVRATGMAVPRLDEGFDAMRIANQEVLERGLQSTNYSLNDLVPKVNTELNVVQFLTPDNNVVGPPVQLDTMLDALSAETYKDFKKFNDNHGGQSVMGIPISEWRGGTFKPEPLTKTEPATVVEPTTVGDNDSGITEQDQELFNNALIGGDVDFSGLFLQPKFEPREDTRSQQEVIKDIVDGKNVVETDIKVANKSYSELIHKWENPSNKGYNEGTGKFMPHSSPEGDRADQPEYGAYEIGDGIKLKKDWLGDDKSKWFELNGEKIDMRNGIDKDTHDQIKDKYITDATKRVASLSGFDKMTSYEKLYWTDFTYNTGKSGSQIMKANPSATKALKAGNTVEAMVRTFDTTSAGSAGRLRGLLKRRISMYNSATSENAGAPPVVGYKWSEGGVKVKFASAFLSDKVDDNFNKNLDEDGWYTVHKSSSMKNARTRIQSPTGDKVWTDF